MLGALIGWSRFFSSIRGMLNMRYHKPTMGPMMRIFAKLFSGDRIGFSGKIIAAKHNNKQKIPAIYPSPQAKPET